MSNFSQICQILIKLLKFSQNMSELVKPSTSIQMDGALRTDFSKSETDSDIITKLFSVIYVQKL